MEQIIYITENSRRQPVAPDIDLYRDTEDSIRWINQTGHDYAVDFPKGSPFKGAPFKIIAGQNESSGPIDVNAAPGSYHYNLTPAAVGAMAADPTVIVHDK